MNKNIKRRDFLRGMGTLTAAGLVSRGFKSARADSHTAPRHLFVIGALGGANILDSFMPLARDASAEAPGITSFAPSLIETVKGVDLRCVAPLTSEIAGPPPYSADFAQRTFLERHGADTAVMTLDHSSVNHGVGQRRAMNGGGTFQGRNLLEAVAAKYGDGMPLAAVNMMAGEFSQAGIDPALPEFARQVNVADARFFSLGAHGSLGLPLPVEDQTLARARAARDTLEQVSPFSTSFAHVQNRQRYLQLRERALQLEASGLAQKTSLVALPGFPAPAELPRISELLPNIATDTFEAQAALAYLLVKNGGSCAVGISPSDALSAEAGGTAKEPGAIRNPALAFDSSHNTHRIGQHVMWSRILRVSDALITLLKETEEPGFPGSSLWDHSLIYVATEFGRTRGRPVGFTRFGTGHFQNNGAVMISPLLRGGRVYGGLDTSTGLTYGFDRQSGAPVVGSTMAEKDVFSVVCQAMNVAFDGRTDVPTIVR